MTQIQFSRILDSRRKRINDTFNKAKTVIMSSWTILDLRVASD